MLSAIMLSVVEPNSLLNLFHNECVYFICEVSVVKISFYSIPGTNFIQLFTAVI
jgi:hypothetical protein